ncbi:hypothetical protein EGJ08_13360 [Stutzerimonas stutzeri]|nr:hypothetical protein EGJ08_13360 [Stutzerimonas stutzeri]RTM22774.1 hypothetical protein EKN22_10035 [Stutzerimonas stutzeri]
MTCFFSAGCAPEPHFEGGDGFCFALLGESLFPDAEKVTKNALPLHTAPRYARVRSLHRCSRGRLTRAIHGPLSLSPHPCGSPPCTAIPLTLLKGRQVSPDDHWK